MIIRCANLRSRRRHRKNFCNTPSLEISASLNQLLSFQQSWRKNSEIRPQDISFNSTARMESFLYQEMTMNEFMFRIIRHFLNKYDNNVLEVARKLDIGKSSLYRYLKEMEAAGI